MLFSKSRLEVDSREAMASALFSFIDSIGETFEDVVENVESVVGTVEKEANFKMSFNLSNRL